MALGTGCALLLAIARTLTPDPHGLGTHMQLGLPPCMFHALTSLPCPACGLTTSFAWLARGQLTHALHANPFGLVLFALTLLGVPASAWAAACKLSLRDTYMRVHGDRIAFALVALALASWLVRVTVMLRA